MAVETCGSSVELRLDPPDRGAEDARGEESWPEGASGVLAQQWQLAQCEPLLLGQLVDLPRDLIFVSRCLVGVHKGRRLHGVRGCAQRVCAHVCDAGGLGR